MFFTDQKATDLKEKYETNLKNLKQIEEYRLQQKLKIEREKQEVAKINAAAVKFEEINKFA